MRAGDGAGDGRTRCGEAVTAMGRTNPTFRDVLRGYEDRWSGFRRALRHRDRPHFDRLLDHADGHADAAGYCNPDDPVVPILLAMLLEHEKRVAALEERLDERIDAAPPDAGGDGGRLAAVGDEERGGGTG